MGSSPVLTVADLIVVIVLLICAIRMFIQHKNADIKTKLLIAGLFIVTEGVYGTFFYLLLRS